MALAGTPGRRKNHIRSVRKYFLSSATDPDRPLPSRPPCHEVAIAGTPSSPWPLPFAVNLALCAAESDEPALLAVSAARLPAAARFLGAGPGHLGLRFDAGASAVAIEPRPGLTLAPHALLPLLSRHRSLRWVFALDPPGRRRASWLYLEEGPSEGSFADPRPHGGDPLFLLGLGGFPPPRPEAFGVWGSLPVGALLEPERPSLSPLLSGGERIRRPYRGYLEALRHLNAKPEPPPEEGAEL